MTLYTLIQYAVLLLLGASVLYLLFFSLAGLAFHPEVLPKPRRFRRMAVLIPAYKEDQVIVEVARSALQQHYPMSAFDVVVIADSLQEATLEELRAIPVKLIEVRFERSTKSKALNAALDQLEEKYDVAVVLDADNIMAPDFLARIQAGFDAGYMALQGHRTAKNLDNDWATLDAISEEINNHIFRKGHRAVGLSSAIIGSGMAFQYGYFRQLMAPVRAVGGFDKEIELRMLKQGIRIGYIDDAYVYDEKIREAAVFGQQRRRWLSAQVHYLRRGLRDALRDLVLKGNIDYFAKAIQFIQPPRVLLLASVVVGGALFVPLNLHLGIQALNMAWATMAFALVLSLLVGIPRHLYNKRTLASILTLPMAAFVMLGSLLRIRGANKRFLHTRHQSTPIRPSL